MALELRSSPASFLNRHEVVRRSIFVERRQRVRAQLHWELYFALRGHSDLVRTVTRDLSSEGFYCVLRGDFVPGQVLECTLSVPAFDRNGLPTSLPLACKARVVRVEVLDESGGWGIGCAIEDYHFVETKAKAFSASHSENAAYSESVS